MYQLNKLINNIKKIKLYKLLNLYFIIFSNNYIFSNNINFNFENKKLIDIIYDISKIKKINIILPQAQNDLEQISKQKVTYTPNEKEINIKKAWDLLILFLDLSGYSIIKKDKKTYKIVSKNNITRSNLDLYINTDPEKIPYNNEYIRYIYYLKNIKINTTVEKIIKDLSSGDSEFISLDSQNGFILVDKANIISSIITIISKLDESGFREVIEYLPIYNLPCNEVSSILNTLKKAVGKKEFDHFIRYDNKIDDINYFGADVIITPDIKQNALIIMGPEKAVDIISNFVKNHIDKPQDSGKSILHYYNLEYLDAQKFAPILQEVINNYSQNKQATQSIYSNGPYKKIIGAVIKAEEAITNLPIENSLNVSDSMPNKDTNNAETMTGIQSKFISGGNRLLIAALDQDWQEIKKIIKKLDKPEPQVLLEVVILDVTVTNTRLLQSTTRSRTDSPILTSGMQFLSSNISSPSYVLGKDATQIAKDLLAFVGPNNIPSTVPAGSALITFNDSRTPGIAAIINELSKYTQTEVVTNPFVVVLNNQKGNLEQKVTQRTRGDANAAQSGSYNISIENVVARIKLSFAPIIADKNKLKLSVGVLVEEFIDNAQGKETLNKTTKGIITTSNLANNQILAIGGLNKRNITNKFTRTPILGDIPIIGNLFRGELLEVQDISIIILIKPNILNADIKNKNKFKKEKQTENEYTKEKIDNIYKRMSNDYFLYNFKDPILKKFLEENNLLNNLDIIEQFIDLSDNLENLSDNNTKNSLILGTKNKNKLNNKLDYEKIKSNLKDKLEIKKTLDF